MLNILNAVLADGKQANLGFILFQVAFLIVAALVLTLILLPKRKKATQTVTKVEPAVTTESESTVVAAQATVVAQPAVKVIQPVIVEKIVEIAKPVIVGEESVEAGRLRYDKSFEARLIQSDDEIKHWYTEIKNELLSYKTCKARMSWKRETFKANKQVVAMLVYRGNTLCLFVPLNYADYADNKEIETTDLPTYAETPVMIRLKNEKRKKTAIELISKVMEQAQVVRKPGYISEDFYVPYEGILELINKGLIRREIRAAIDEAIFDQPKKED